MTSMLAYIEAVSLAAPGLENWAVALPVLRGEQPYVAAELAAYQPALLPPNERRRASATVRMGFRVAEAACNESSVPAAALATVFASADGDLAIAQRICQALTQTPPLVSPTDFHNSVHNAAAGYWSIAAQAQGPSTAIAAHDDSFLVGLLEALGMVCIEQQPTLLVTYDLPAPAPLQAKRLVPLPCGVGLILTPTRSARTLATLQCTAIDSASTPCRNPALEALRQQNPAARALPLLEALASGRDTVIDLAGNNGSLRLDLRLTTPCHE